MAVMAEEHSERRSDDKSEGHRIADFGMKFKGLQCRRCGPGNAGEGLSRMKLFEALALRKALQNQLAQLVSLRNSTFEYPEDEKPAFDFEELTKRIKEKVNDVTSLKLAIMGANMSSKLPNGLTLYEGIIELANTRSAIDQLQDLIQIGKRGFFLGDRRRSTTEIRMIKQASPESILKMIEHYDTKRRVLDAMIQEPNHSVEIAWSPKQ
jgi:hypothetical protein